MSPATGSVAASSSEQPSGSGASDEVATATSSAQAPARVIPTTRVPAGGPEPSAAGCSTTPATSQPVTVPGGSSGSRRTSPRLRENAVTRTSAWEGSGCGSGTSLSSTCGGWAAEVRASIGRDAIRTPP